MISLKEYLQEKAKDPCWTGYKQLGMKQKNGKQVPNCIPEEEECPKCHKTPCECGHMQESGFNAAQ